MNTLGQYILTVTAAAILLAILQSLAGQGTMGAVVRLVGGVFMALTVISPLMKLELPDMEEWFVNYSVDGQAAAGAGEEMAEKAARAIIKEQTQAYILDKAALYDAVLSVEVELDDAGVPAAVKLTGQVSAQAQKELQQIIEEDLGLGEEAQQWSG